MTKVGQKSREGNLDYFGFLLFGIVGGWLCGSLASRSQYTVPDTVPVDTIKHRTKNGISSMLFIMVALMSYCVLSYFAGGLERALFTIVGLGIGLIVHRAFINVLAVRGVNQ